VKLIPCCILSEFRVDVRVFREKSLTVSVSPVRSQYFYQVEGRIDCFPLLALRSAWKPRDESGEGGKKFQMDISALIAARRAFSAEIRFPCSLNFSLNPSSLWSWLVSQRAGIVDSSFARGKREISGGTILVLRHRMLPRTFPTTSSPF